MEKPKEKYDHWEDEDFLKELKSRIDDFESGKDEGIPWEEVKIKARSRYNDKHPTRHREERSNLYTCKS
jgi:hypothetical protein